jgi:uncharacterized Fe-S cluster-containing radical SAM superfamily protein
VRDASRGIETVALLVTRACQLDCVYCRFRRDKPAMDDALLRRCADLALETDSEECSLVFLGGEPLLRLDKVLETMDYASARRAAEFPGKKLSFSVTTNGLLLGDAALDALGARGASIQLSLDGSRQESQRPLKAAGKPYPSAALDAAFARLVRRKIPFAVHSVISPDGVGSVFDDAMAYLERGAPQVHFQYRVGVEWTREAGFAYVDQVARVAEEARRRGLPLEAKELMDSNEPAIVSWSVTVDVDGLAYLGCTVPAMEEILPALKKTNLLGDARRLSLRELAAVAPGAWERALAAHRGDGERERIVASNLAMGRICMDAVAGLRRKFSGRAAV